LSSDLRDQLQLAIGNAYRIDRELSSGGVAHVFVAEELSTSRWIVVKDRREDAWEGVQDHHPHPLSAAHLNGGRSHRISSIDIHGAAAVHVLRRTLSLSDRRVRPDGKHGQHERRFEQGMSHRSLAATSRSSGRVRMKRQRFCISVESASPRDTIAPPPTVDERYPMPKHHDARTRSACVPTPHSAY